MGREVKKKPPNARYNSEASHCDVPLSQPRQGRKGGQPPKEVTGDCDAKLTTAFA